MNSTEQKSLKIAGCACCVFAPLAAILPGFFHRPLSGTIVEGGKYYFPEKSQYIDQKNSELGFSARSDATSIGWDFGRAAGIGILSLVFSEKSPEVANAMLWAISIYTFSGILQTPEFILNLINNRSEK